jgi:hypothetical protein
LKFSFRLWSCFAFNRTPLYIASLAGYVQIVTLLHDTGADPNVRDKVCLVLKMESFCWLLVCYSSSHSVESSRHYESVT